MNAYTMMLGPDRVNSKGEASYKKVYSYISLNKERCLKFLDITQCEFSVGILGSYATVVRQRSEFSLCKNILEVDKVIFDRYFELCNNLDDGLDKASAITCLEGLKYKYLMIKFNLFRDIGDSGTFPIPDIRFMMKYELKKALSGEFYIDEDEVDSRKQKLSARCSCEILWMYRQIIVEPLLLKDKNAFFSEVVGKYGRNVSRDQIDKELQNLGSKKTKEIVLRGLTDKQIFDFYHMYTLVHYESELNSTGLWPQKINYDLVVKHKFFDSFMEQIKSLIFCANPIQDTKDHKLQNCACKQVQYCDSTCAKANWKIH